MLKDANRPVEMFKIETFIKEKVREGLKPILDEQTNTLNTQKDIKDE